MKMQENKVLGVSDDVLDDSENLYPEDTQMKTGQLYAEYPVATNTFMVEYEGRFLLAKRSNDEDKFQGLWAFIGGRTENNETTLETMIREVKEETGIEITDEFGFLNTYKFETTKGYSFGNTFMCRARNDVVQLSSELCDYKWVSSIDDLRGLECIDGIYNHLEDAIHYLHSMPFQSIKRANLLDHKYINVKNTVDEKKIATYPMGCVADWYAYVDSINRFCYESL